MRNTAVIPAKAGIQRGISEQTSSGLYFGKQTKWHPLYWSDFKPRQEDMGAQKQHGGRFSKRYGVHQLVWYEVHESMESAIEREKRLKEWKRKWKLELIESSNPNWQDLYNTIV